MSYSIDVRPVVSRALGTLLGIAGLAELDGTEGLVPAELVRDRRGELSDTRTRAMLRTGDGPRQRAQLAVAGPLARVSASTEYPGLEAVPIAARRSMAGRNPSKGYRSRLWIAAGAPATTATPSRVGESLMPAADAPCLGCKR